MGKGCRIEKGMQMKNFIEWEKQRQETLKCAIWAICALGLWLVVLIGTITWFTRVDITADDIHSRRRMTEEIAVLRNEVNGLYFMSYHQHNYSTGLPAYFPSSRQDSGFPKRRQAK